MHLQVASCTSVLTRAARRMEMGVRIKIGDAGMNVKCVIFEDGCMVRVTRHTSNDTRKNASVHNSGCQAAVAVVHHGARASEESWRIHNPIWLFLDLWGKILCQQRSNKEWAAARLQPNSDPQWRRRWRRHCSRQQTEFKTFDP